jgi:cytochrome c-type biogenesis protein CcmH
MSTFLIVAAVMAAIAAGIAAWPLLRDRSSRITGAILAVCVIGAAALLYPLWSTFNWHAPAQDPGGPDPAAMVAKLEKRLITEPNNLQGWVLLGRSYLALQRLDDAIVAYDHAHRLDANNAEAAMGLGEAMSLRAGGEITPQAGELFEQAIRLAPDNPQALLFSGFAAAGRGERELARSRWQALKKLDPPPQIMEMLDARIASLGLPAAEVSAGTTALPAGTNASAGGLAPAHVTVNISIAPSLKSRVATEAPLFVFAREPGSQGPPLAAKRLTTGAIGSQVQLTSADSMIPGRVLTDGKQVSITARISFSGQPVPTAGDLYGELSYAVGHDGPRDLVIDRVAE